MSIPFLFNGGGLRLSWVDEVGAWGCGLLADPYSGRGGEGRGGERGAAGRIRSMGAQRLQENALHAGDVVVGVGGEDGSEPGPRAGALAGPAPQIFQGWVCPSSAHRLRGGDREQRCK